MACLIEFFCVVGPRLGGVALEEGPAVLEAQLVHSYPADVRSSVSPASVASLCFPHGVSVTRSAEAAHGFETALTDGEGRRLYGAVVVVARRLDEGWWTSTALCVVSRYPVLAQHRAFLAQLVRISRSDKAPCRLETFIATYCRETPVPPRGVCRVLVSLGDTALWLARPAPNELPHCDVANIETLFDCLSAANVVAVWASLVVEARVALVSKHLHKFGRVAMALVALLFPLEWRGALVPVCPARCVRELVEAPVPFVVGGLEPEYLAEPADRRPPGVILVDLDKDAVHFPDDAPAPVLPSRQAAKLIKRLRDVRAASGGGGSTSPRVVKTFDEPSLSVDDDEPFSPPQIHRVPSAARAAEDNVRHFGVVKSLDDPVAAWSSDDGIVIRDLLDDLAPAASEKPDALPEAATLATQQGLGVARAPRREKGGGDPPSRSTRLDRRRRRGRRPRRRRLAARRARRSLRARAPRGFPPLPRRDHARLPPVPDTRRAPTAAAEQPLVGLVRR